MNVEERMMADEIVPLRVELLSLHRYEQGSSPIVLLLSLYKHTNYL